MIFQKEKVYGYQTQPPNMLDAENFLLEKKQRLVLDVRSPGEFAQGHIPGAVSFPLFFDHERAEVGTIYKQIGPDAALQLGLEFVGPKMANFVREARQLAPSKRLLVHCWRGGKRSESMAWLLRTAGFEVGVLAGGYKNYRRHVLEQFEKMNLNLHVVGGRTGVGKTKILHELGRLGEQIIDLEALAHHKGSAFGSLGEAPQPTVEQFENDLFEKISERNHARRIWVENESRKIGRCVLPDGFWNKLRRAPLFNVEIPHTARLKNLLDDYARFSVADLEHAFQKIGEKLGGQNLKTALRALHHGDLAEAADIALQYYDKTYQHGLETRHSEQIHFLKFENADPLTIANAIRIF